MKPFARRHLTTSETNTIVALLEEIGPVEILRMVGQWICHSHNDITIGSSMRTAINKIAKEIQEDERNYQ